MAGQRRWILSIGPVSSSSTFRPVVAVVFLLMVLIRGFCVSAGDAPTFAAWMAACARLPSNRELGSKRPPAGLLPLPSFAPVDAALDAFFSSATNGPMASGDSWVGGTPPRDGFFDVTHSWFAPPEIPFQPFARKWVLPPDSRVILMGDLHGDIRSLITVLGRFQERRWFDGFKLIEPGMHLVFLGDYTDRGHYGVEVLYTLLRLKEANPDRVHLVRGNHEDINLVARYGFLAEGESKYGAGFHAARILRAYDFLPVAMYLGCGADFVQLCHGGMEPGYDPAALLTSSGTNRYQLLGRLQQSAFLSAHPDWLASEPASASAARREYQDFTPVAPVSPTTLGFMWNDFTVFSDEPVFVRNPDRAFIYGRPAVEGLLAHAGRNGTRVHAVIRAHQHSSVSNPMMRRLIAGRGVFRHWQEAQDPVAVAATPAALAQTLEVTETRSLPENSVWTLNVTPDSVYGAGCGYRFATFAVLKTAGRFSDWRIAVETVEVPGI